MINLDLQDVVFGQKTMAGSIVGGRADMEEMLRFCADKGVEPMVQMMKLSQVGWREGAGKGAATRASGRARQSCFVQSAVEERACKRLMASYGGSCNLHAGLVVE